MIGEVVKKYLELYPEDKKQLKLLIDQLNDKDKLDDRRNFRGHITGDAIVFSPDCSKVLYIYHPLYGTWQQPGGHWDSPEDGPWDTAKREAIEETGVQIRTRIGPIESDYRVPLYIITGKVPTNNAKNEPKHWHHDFRYGFIAKTEKLDKTSDKVIKDVRWVDLAKAKKMENTGHDVHKSIDRMISLL